MIFDKILKFRYIQNTSILVGDIVRFNIWNNRFSPSLYRIIRQKPFHYFNKDLMEIFFQKNSPNICSLSENAYICCRNNNKSHENKYSKYILVVALFTTHQVVRNQSSCIYYRNIKKVCRTYGGPFFI